MVAKTPVRAVFDGDTATGLAEFQTGEFVDYSFGGTGLSSLGSSGQVLKVNSGATALEYGYVEAVVNIDNANDLTGSTLTSTDLFLISDGGTEGRATLAQIQNAIKDETATLTNKTISGSSNTLSNIGNSSLTNSSITIADDSSTVSTISLGETLKFIGGSGITTTISGDTITFATDGAVVTETSTDTLTNKSMDADNNTFTNIANASIKSGAAIDAAKIHDGSISNTEFGYLNGVTSNIQTQLTSLDTLKAPLASPTFTGTVSAPTPTTGDNSTKVATTEFVTNAVAVENELAEMNDVDITSVSDADFLVYDSAATKWENQAISGAVTINNTGVATLSAGVDATKIADGSVDNTEFQYLNGVTSAIQTQIDSKTTPAFAIAQAIALG
jgi:hypothetical protein